MPLNDKEIRKTHPSYGLIGIARSTCSGKGARLFGSAVGTHHEVICLTIKRAEAMTSLGGLLNHVFGHETLIEVALSPAQYVALISSPNVGDGVPCTIERLLGVMIDPPPAEKVAVEQARDHFQNKTAELVVWMCTRRSDLKTILAKDRLTKADKEQISDLLETVIREVGSNMPYAVRVFGETTEKVVAAAKAELDAFVTGAVNRLGLTKLRELASGAFGDGQAALGSGHAEEGAKGPLEG
jgi:hypothetical protein